MSSISDSQPSLVWTWQQKLHGYFSLARVSNSPTVVSNVLTGVALAGALSAQNTVPIVLLATAMVAFYTAGMYLNDLCDYEFDRVKRPDRPLPSGLVSRSSAALVTIGLLVLGSILLLSIGTRPFLVGLVLIGLIVFYDAWHKTNPFSPLVMAGTRMMVYVTTFLAFSPDISSSLLIAIGLLLSYIVGLTYIAKSETGARFTKYWPVATLFLPAVYFVFNLSNPVVLVLLVPFVLWVSYSISFVYRRQHRHIGSGIIRLIAGISLLDSLLIAAAGFPAYALLAIFTFGFTLFLQRYIQGT
jgi:hypothetical protein